MKGCDERAVMDDESMRVETDGESIKSICGIHQQFKGSQKSPWCPVYGNSLDEPNKSWLTLSLAA